MRVAHTVGFGFFVKPIPAWAGAIQLRWLLSPIVLHLISFRKWRCFSLRGLWEVWVTFNKKLQIRVIEFGNPHTFTFSIETRMTTTMTYPVFSKLTIISFTTYLVLYNILIMITKWRKFYFCQNVYYLEAPSYSINDSICDKTVRVPYF